MKFRKLAFVLISILALGSSWNQANAQSIESIFKQFDFELNYPLAVNDSVKNILLKNGSLLLPPDEDRIQERISVYIDSNHISLTGDCVTGRNGFYTISLHKFRRTDGSVLVGYSKYGGGIRSYDHHELKFYNYSEGVFTQDSTIQLPDEILIGGFLTPNVSDSLAKVVESNVNTHISFGVDQVNDVQYLLHEGAPGYSEWIKTHAIKYLWNGEKFEPKKDVPKKDKQRKIERINCGCPALNLIPENQHPCDTTVLSSGAMLYWQWNCDSSWYTFENKEKVTLKKCFKETPYGCDRTGYQFVNEYDNYLMFINKSVSGCCPQPTVLFLDKRTGEDLWRVTKKYLIHIDYERDAILYFEDTLYQKLVYFDQDKNVKYCTYFNYNQVLGSLKKNRKLWLSNLFNDYTYREDMLFFNYKNIDDATEERLIDLSKPENPLTTDANRLNTLRYMRIDAHRTNCDNKGGSNAEHKVCLNKEFQQVDSLLNSTYKKVIAEMENDSARRLFVDFHLIWVRNRAQQAELVSTGYRGHMFGIKYLYYMVVASESRIRELKVFLEH